MGWRRSPGEGSLGQGKPVAGVIPCNEEAFCFLDSPPLLRFIRSMSAAFS